MSETTKSQLPVKFLVHNGKVVDPRGEKFYVMKGKIQDASKKKLHLLDLPPHILDEIAKYFIFTGKKVNLKVVLRPDWFNQPEIPIVRKQHYFAPPSVEGNIFLVSKQFSNMLRKVLYGYNTYQLNMKKAYRSFLFARLGNSLTFVYHLVIDGGLLENQKNPANDLNHLGANIVQNMPSLRRLELKNVGRGKARGPRNARTAFHAQIWLPKKIRQIESITKLPGNLFDADVYCSTIGYSTKLYSKQYVYEIDADEVLVDMSVAWDERRQYEETLRRQRKVDREARLLAEHSKDN